MVVEKNDVITLPLGTDWALQPVEWSQKLKHCRDDYYTVEYTNTTRSDPDSSGVIFISRDKLEAFKALSLDQSNHDTLTVTVTEDFVYGERKPGAKRFLVYHDKQRRIFQYRFVKAAFMNVVMAGEDFVEKLGFQDVRSITDVAKWTFGDDLQVFR
ncbi:hypothetical protein BJY04DRAFT_41531 [Aspergillus karnatakaensis]|uniref:uncharacterized protein n=1 Tax=Aspergillus karnatakaensis TaxID=1810916 RepID=UPI003CCD0D10